MGTSRPRAIPFPTRGDDAALGPPARADLRHRRHRAGRRWSRPRQWLLALAPIRRSPRRRRLAGATGARATDCTIGAARHTHFGQPTRRPPRARCSGRCGPARGASPRERRGRPRRHGRRRPLGGHARGPHSGRPALCLVDAPRRDPGSRFGPASHPPASAPAPGRPARPPRRARRARNACPRVAHRSVTSPRPGTTAFRLAVPDMSHRPGRPEPAPGCSRHDATPRNARAPAASSCSPSWRRHPPGPHSGSRCRRTSPIAVAAYRRLGSCGRSDQLDLAPPSSAGGAQRS